MSAFDFIFNSYRRRQAFRKHVWDSGPRRVQDVKLEDKKPETQLDKICKETKELRDLTRETFDSLSVIVIKLNRLHSDAGWLKWRVGRWGEKNGNSTLTDREIRLLEEHEAEVREMAARLAEKAG